MNYPLLKSLFDKISALLLVIILAPVFVLIGLVLLTVNKGKVLFFQKRSGLHKRPFIVYKFRTMRDPKGMDETGRDRITPIGRMLRKTSLDELPQLFNVINGGMSFVGPRPLLPEYNTLLSDEHSIRFTVKPGITGLAQVSGGERLPWVERFDLDREYVKNLSFLSDLKILLRTIGIVFKQASDHYESFEKFEGYDQ